MTNKQTPMNHADERLEYLKDAYAIYSNHINSMFNFYLVAGGLVANAYVQLLNPALGLPTFVKLIIAGLGFLLSCLFLLIHLRSREILDTIESALKAEERRIFGNRPGFLISLPQRKWSIKKHSILFPAVYVVFILAFGAMTLLPSPQAPREAEEVEQSLTTERAQ